MARRRPHPGLATYVDEYVGYVERSDRPVARREVPTGRVTLILGLGDPMDMRPAARPAPVRLTSFVAGLHDVHTDTRHDGRQHGIQVDLTPPGASRLLGVAATALANAVVPLDDLRGRQAVELVERIAECPTWSTRFDLLDRVLLAWVEDGPPGPDPAIVWAWQQLDRSGGLVLVSALADEIGWSRSRFAARFRTEIGLTPKATGRVLRFRRAVDLLTSDGSTSISDVAAACGFADHSHLVRDFRSLAGCTPSQLLADRRGDDLSQAISGD
jgi:AraC-like DNA-binding protein